MKRLLIGFAILMLFLSAPIASAQCLATEQIFLIGKVAEQSNVSIADFVGIFEAMCERDINMTSNLTLISEADVNATIDNYLADYKADIENKMNIADILTNNTLAIQAMTTVMNTSQAIDMIDSKVDDIESEFTKKQDAFEEKVDTKIRDLDAEQVSKTSFNNLKDNVSHIGVSVHQLQMEKQRQPQQTGSWEGWAAIIVVVVIVGGLLYFRRKKSSEEEAALLSAPIRHERPGFMHVSHMDDAEALKELRRYKEFIEAGKQQEAEDQAEADKILSEQIQEEKKQRKKEKQPDNSEKDNPFGAS